MVFGDKKLQNESASVVDDDAALAELGYKVGSTIHEIQMWTDSIDVAFI